MAWYNSSWPYRTKVTVDHTKVPSDQSNFTVYVDLNALPAGFHSNCNQTDARDIRVTTSDEVTEIPREVVFYTAASDTGELHFKGNVSSSTDTSFYIYYGNSGATEPAVGSTYGRNNVWTGYTNVYHLQATTGTDSTGTQDGTNSGAAVATGKVNSGLDFQTTDYMDIGQASTHLDTLTVTAWVKHSAINSDQVVVCKGYDGANTEWQLTTNAANNPFFGTYNGVQRRAVWGSTVTTGTWYKFDGKYDGTNYMMNVNNGTKVSTADSTNPVNTTIKTAIGSVWVNNSSLTQYFQGVIDEVRIAPTALSDNWLTTEYNNQNSPSTFYTVGPQEAFINVSDTVGSSESIGRTLINNVNVSDSTSLTESVSAQIFSSGLTVNVSDTITTSDTPTVLRIEPDLNAVITPGIQNVWGPKVYTP